MSLSSPPPTAPDSARPARRSGLPRRLVRDTVSVICLIVLGVIVAAAVLAPVLTSHDPVYSSLADTLAPMGPDHPLGGDGVGRDVLARLLYGARTSLLGALLTVLVALALGVPTGLVAGYYGGRIDTVLSWIANLIMAVPAIIVMLVVMAILSSNIYVAMAVLGVIVYPGVYRLIRASTTSVRRELYVDAARVAGLGGGRIIGRHVLPVVQAPTVLQCVQIVEIAIGIQAGLVFLGLGSASQPSWGGMLNDAFANIYAAPTLLVWPALAIGMTIGSLSLLSNSVRDLLGSGGKRKRRRRSRLPVVAANAEGRTTPAPSPDGTEPLLVVKNLRVTYPRDGVEVAVVDGVDLRVERGQILGLVGESGSGKSQTAFSILGLIPDAAKVCADRLVFDGTSLTGLNPAQMNKLRGGRIAYVPQEPMSNLDPSFTIGDQLIEPIRKHLGLGRKDAKERALSLLERVGITDTERVYKAYPHEISGGMAQRVLIAGAVSCDPDLLIADEPTTALDVTVQADVLDLLRSLQRERGMGVILVTHNFGVVADLCDQVAVMRSGTIVECAAAEDLFRAPQHEYTRTLLGSTLENIAPRSALSPIADTGDMERSMR